LARIRLAISHSYSCLRCTEDKEDSQRVEQIKKSDMETSTKLSTPKKMLEDLHMIGLILIASLIQKNAVQVDETVRRIKKKVAIFETIPLPAAPNNEIFVCS
jgi:hypothetical protein